MAPPQEHETEYIIYLSTEDRVVTRFTSAGKKVIVFAVVYWALIDGRWHKVSSFDNSHDSDAHQHHYHTSEDGYQVLFPWPNPNEALTEAKKIVRLNYQKMRTNYLQAKHKRLK
jgi:hypothetical protein